MIVSALAIVLLKGFLYNTSPLFESWLHMGGLLA
jgi:hypothetical protein